MIAPMTLPALPMRSNSAPCAPAPRPTQTEPCELLDLSTIDSAAEAAQLPILEPAFQLALAAGVVTAMLGGGSERQEIAVVNKFPGTCLDTVFTLNLKNQEAPLTVQGSFNGKPIAGSASLQETVQWSVTTGENQETLEVEPGLDQESVRLEGRLGAVPASLSIAPLMNGELFEGVRTTGMLGGYEYNCETRLSNGRAALEGGVTTMVARGQVGELPIDKNYTITPSQGLLTVEGRGLNAGVEQDVFVALSL